MTEQQPGAGLLIKATAQLVALIVIAVTLVRMWLWGTMWIRSTSPVVVANEIYMPNGEPADPLDLVVITLPLIVVGAGAIVVTTFVDRAERRRRRGRGTG